MSIEGMLSFHLPEFALWRGRLELAIRVLLLIFIASLPFRQLLVVERNGFLLLLGLLLIWSAMQGRLWFVPTPFDIPLLALVSWITLTIPFSTFPVYSFAELGKLLQGVVIFYAILWFLQSEKHRTWLLYLLVAMVMITSAAGIYQFDPGDYQATRSFLTSEVWLTTFLVMFAPLSWALAAYAEERRTRAFFMLSAALSTGCLLMTQSRAGIVALLVEGWLFAWLHKDRIVRLVVMTMSGLIITSFVAAMYADQTPTDALLSEWRSTIPLRTTTRSVEHRLDIWSFGLSEVAKHPVMGIGYGSEILRMQYPDDGRTRAINDIPVRNVGTHNIFLYMALHIGIPGLLIFLWFVAVLLRTLFRSHQVASRFPSNAVLLGAGTGIAGLLVRLQFDQMFVGTLAILFWVLVGLAVLHTSVDAQDVSNKKLRLSKVSGV